jgi:hypothetical protein
MGLVIVRSEGTRDPFAGDWFASFTMTEAAEK